MHRPKEGAEGVLALLHSIDSDDGEGELIVKHASYEWPREWYPYATVVDKRDDQRTTC